MKQRLLIVLFALSLFFTSCGSDNDLQGNWIKYTSFKGVGRIGAVSVTIDSDGDGKADIAYVGTGYDGKKALTSFYKFTLKEGWTDIDPFPGEARQDAVAFVSNGKIYVGTGMNDDQERLDDFYAFDPKTEKWDDNAIVFPGGKRQGAVAFSINDIGYFGTGYGIIEGKDRQPLNDFYKYENGEWTSLNYPGDPTLNSTAFVINNKAYMVSGEGDARENVYVFDPESGWSSNKRILDEDFNSEKVIRSKAVSFVINNKGYIATGQNGGIVRDVWEYDPESDEWREKTSLELEVESRIDAVSFTLDNRGFITTGGVPTVSSNYPKSTWEFNPNMDEDDQDNF
jgi:N-acetylneuraminic acid mutarotase